MKGNDQQFSRALGWGVGDAGKRTLGSDQGIRPPSAGFLVYG
jgi:hypothetical protein